MPPGTIFLIGYVHVLLLPFLWMDSLGTIEFVTLHLFDVLGLISLTIAPEDIQRDIIAFLLLSSRSLASNMIRFQTLIYMVCAVLYGTAWL
jgi:hypothetical protein